MGFSTKLKSRRWIGTIHIKNMINAGLSEEQYKDPEYCANFFKQLWENSGKGRIAAVSVCESAEGTYHAHPALYGSPTTLKCVSDIFFQSHIEPQLGTKEQLRDYILKEGKYSAKGEKVLYTVGIEDIMCRQGNRSDLEEIEKMLNEGCSPEQIYQDHFSYRRYDKMIRSHYMSLRIKETPLEKNMWNEYHFGQSGSGKTYTYIKLCEEYTPEEVYLCNDYANSSSSGGGFDFYSNNPAKILILDEFRGNVPFATLLNILDVYSRNQQHARYQNTYCLWTSVYICSIFPPEEVYKFMVEDAHRSTDSIRQLMRRLNSIVYHWVDKEGHFRSYTLPSSDYKNALQIKNLALQYEKNVPYDERISDKDSGDALQEFGAKLRRGGQILG